MNGEHVKLVGLLANERVNEILVGCKLYVQQFAFYHDWQSVEKRRIERTTVVCVSIPMMTKIAENYFNILYNFIRSFARSSDGCSFVRSFVTYTPAVQRGRMFCVNALNDSVNACTSNTTTFQYPLGNVYKTKIR